MARRGKQRDPDTQSEFGSIGSRPTNDSSTSKPSKRGRPGLIVLTVLLIELVLIAAGVNQGVARHLEDYATRHPRSFPGSFATSALVYAWRFTPSAGMSHAWWGELVTVGGTLLLSMLLVLAIIRGPITWFRAFFGVWMAVTVATVLADMGGILIAQGDRGPTFRFTSFSGGPTGVFYSTRNRDGGGPFRRQAVDAVFNTSLAYAFVAGLALGLVTALVAAIVAVITRRAEPVAAVQPWDPEPVPSQAEAPEPFFGNAGQGRASGGTDGGDTARYGQADYADAHRYASPDRRTEDDSPTTSYPVVDPGQDQSGVAPKHGFDDAYGDPSMHDTTALPRVETPKEQRRPEPRTPEPPAAEQSKTDQSTPEQPETDQPTAAFPLPPDDEELGQHPDHSD